jgi:hypothetical protein
MLELYMAKLYPSRISTRLWVSIEYLNINEVPHLISFKGWIVTMIDSPSDQNIDYNYVLATFAKWYHVMQIGFAMGILRVGFSHTVPEPTDTIPVASTGTYDPYISRYITKPMVPQVPAVYVD